MIKQLLSQYYSFLLSSFIPFFFLSGEIIETDETKTIISSVNPHSFVFFNVNRTLFAPFNVLADHRWKDYFIARAEEVITDYEIRGKLIDHIKNQIDSHVPKVNGEEMTPRLIDLLQQKNIVVLGVTQKQVFNAHVLNLEEVINNHLLSMNIHFGKTLRHFYFSKRKRKKNSNFSFEHGILFTNKHPIGETLISFFKQCDKQPSNVVVIDRSYEALEEIEEALTLAGIPFTGIHYDKSNDFEEFDPTLGTVEFFALIKEGKVLPDEEAIQMMPTDRSVDYETLLDKYIEEY